MFFKKFAFLKSFCLIFLYVFIILSLVSCSYFKYLDLSKMNKKVEIYGKYKLKFTHFAMRASNPMFPFRIDARFIKPFTFDDVNIDTIPILTFDSVCFKGDCINKSISNEFTFALDLPIDTAFYIKHRDIIYRDMSPRDTGFARDLSTTHINGEIWPLSFTVFGGVILPDACKYNEVTAIIYSRLNDRTNGKLIEQDITEVTFDIKRRLKWYRN